MNPGNLLSSKWRQENLFKFILPWLCVFCSLIYLFFSFLYRPQDSGFDFQGFGELPVLHNGRLKPLDTVARSSLLMISGKQTVKGGSAPPTLQAQRSPSVAAPRRLSAIEWFCDVAGSAPPAPQVPLPRRSPSGAPGAALSGRGPAAAGSPRRAAHDKIFLINHPDVIGHLGLAPKEKFFTFDELSLHAEEISAQAAAVEKIEPPLRTPYQRAMYDLDKRLVLYQRLKNSLGVAGSEDFVREIVSYQDAVVGAVAAFRKHMNSGAFSRETGSAPPAQRASGASRVPALRTGAPQVQRAEHAALGRLAFYFERYHFLAQAAYFKALPPLAEDKAQDWVNMGEGLLDTIKTNRLHPAALLYAHMLRARKTADAARFNVLVKEYGEWIRGRFPSEAKKARFESFFNRFEPFYKGIIFYLLALVSLFLSWLFKRRELFSASFTFLILAFTLHSFGLLGRIYLQGRPPVTNLYSSAVFVGFIGTALSLILERLYRKGLGILAAATIGALTLVIAHHLSLSGDTMEMLQAVLDSNFWLATHVVTITIGYSATFLAGILGHIYIFSNLGRQEAGEPWNKALTQMVYGTVCFALFFSFVGTVLGGIWADQSWGRFWGWDPKENGALLIVLWNAMILHARWGGFIRRRGLMAMVVFGNIVTSWSWFGVNMLGIGLHSYGFMDKAFAWLTAFIAFELAVIFTAWLAWRKNFFASPV